MRFFLVIIIICYPLYTYGLSPCRLNFSCEVKWVIKSIKHEESISGGNFSIWIPERYEILLDIKKTDNKYNFNENLDCWKLYERENNFYILSSDQSIKNISVWSYISWQFGSCWTPEDYVREQLYNIEILNKYVSIFVKLFLFIGIILIISKNKKLISKYFTPN